MKALIQNIERRIEGFYPIGVEWIKIEDFLKSKNHEEVLVISAELALENQVLVSFSGFELIKELRLKNKRRNPIVVSSPLPEEYFNFLAKTNPKFNAIYDPAVVFLEHTFTLQHLNKKIKDLLPLSTSALIDVSNMLYELRGLINDNLRHALMFYKDESQWQKAINECLEWLDDDIAIEIGFKDLYSLLLEFKAKNNEKGFNQCVNAFLQKVEAVIPNERGETSPLNREQEKYGILVVEDDEKTRKDIVSGLKKFGDFNITELENGSKAIKKLEKDTGNGIIAVLCDWRLFKKGSKKDWQNIQGYDILEYAGKSGIRALFALTSLADYDLQQIRNELPVSIELFNKRHLDDEGQWELIVNSIKAKAKAKVELISSMPYAGNWDNIFSGNSLKKEYLAIRSSLKWEKFENNVSIAASDIINEYKDNFRLDKPHDLHMDYHFGYTFAPKNPSVDALRTILIWRRIYLALTDYYDVGRIGPKELSDKVFSIIQPSTGEVDSGKKSQFFYKLCFALRDPLKTQILPEERLWLMK